MRVLSASCGRNGSRTRAARLALALGVAAAAFAGCRAGGVAQGGGIEASAGPAATAPAPSSPSGTGPSGSANASANANAAGGAAAHAFDANALEGPASLGPGANAALKALAAPLQAAAAATGVSADVLGAVAWAESRADPNVAGGGLMQIDAAAFASQQAAHPQIVGDSANAAANAMAAAFYLRAMQAAMGSRYGRTDLGVTLRAYNSGENGVDPNDLSRLPAGTGAAAYVANVTSYAAAIATGAESLPP